MSEIYSDPEKIRSAAHNVASYAEFIDREFAVISGGIDKLSSRWKDQQFREFKDQFDVTAMVLKRFVQKARNVHPVLLEDAKRLAELQSHRYRG